MSRFQFQKVAVGGTFDRLHKGHKELLITAFALGKCVYVGVTSDAMVAGKQLSPIILPYARRCFELTRYLREDKLLDRATIVQLNDPYGPLNDQSFGIQAVVVGPKTTIGVVAKLKKQITIVHCPFIKSVDNHYLSSTRIRRGEIDRNGCLFRLANKKLTLPISLRTTLRAPLGELQQRFVMFQPIEPAMTMTVGDECARTLKENGVNIDMAVFDFRVQRKKKYHSYRDLGFSTDELSRVYVEKVKNPAGAITSVLHQAVKRSVNRYLFTHQQSIIHITGEEDLAVLPAVLYAPLSTVVFYGQPNEGLVRMVVDEKVKKEVARLVALFQTT